MVSVDLAGFLRSWPFDDSDELIARRVRTPDGDSRLQIRLELGVIEMHVDGRPDGRESVLEACRRRSEEGELALTRAQCAELHREALQYGQRRIAYMRLGQFGEAAADAEQHLAIIDLLRDHANDRSDWLRSEKYRPFVIAHLARARVSQAVEIGRFDTALASVDDAIGRLERLFRDDYQQPDLLRESDELQQLRQLRQSLLQHRSTDIVREHGRDRLRRELEEAVAAEDFERAARLRDRLADLDH